MNELQLITISENIAEYLEKEKAEAFIKDFKSLEKKRNNSDIFRKLTIWMLVDKDHGVIKFTKLGSRQYVAIQNVARLFIEDCKDREKFINAYLYAVAATFDGAEDDPHCASYHATRVAVDIASYKVDIIDPFVWYYYIVRSFAAAGRAAFYRNHHRHVAYPAMAEKLIELMKAETVLPKASIILTRIKNKIYANLLFKSILEEKAGALLEKFDSLLEQRDTSDVWRQFVIWMLTDPAYGVIKFTKIGSIQYDAIQRVAQLYIDNCKDVAEWRAASSEVEAAWLGVIVGISDATFHAGHAAGHAAAAARWHLTASVHGGVAVDIAALAAGLFVDSYLGAAVEDAVDSGNDRGGARERYVILMAYKLIDLIKAAPVLK